MTVKRTLVACLLALPLAAPALAADDTVVLGPVKPFDFTKDLRSLPRATPGPEQPAHERERPPVDPAWALVPQPPDPVVQRSIDRSRTPTPGVEFAGLGFTGFRPPDTIGDIGPNHYIEMVNTNIGIFDRTGSILVGPVLISSVWAGFPGPCSTSNAGDPVVVYDRLADRWVVSQFHSGPNGICVAVSKTGDPVAGGWWLYDFSGLSSFPDYFKIGIWPDAYYVGANATSNRAFAFDRPNMLNGAAATAIIKTTPAVGVHSMLAPSDHDGPTPPPAGSPGVFYRHVDDAVGGGVDRIELFEFHVDFATPANATFTGPTAIPTAPFTSLCNFSFSCVFQPGTAQRLDSVTEWPMWRLAYKNFGTHEVLLANNAVDAGAGKAGIRWYELRRTPPGSGAWAIEQQGTFAPAPATSNHWMASLAMDNSGNIGLGYTTDDTSAVTPINPSVGYTGRLATDPPGVMTQGETIMEAGTGVQTGSNRWGDYSAMSIDPTDECTFWYAGEYMLTGNAWATRVGSFTLPSCTPVPVKLQDFRVE
jgi:hypothetical protein